MVNNIQQKVWHNTSNTIDIEFFSDKKFAMICLPYTLFHNFLLLRIDTFSNDTSYWCNFRIKTLWKLQKTQTKNYRYNFLLAIAAVSQTRKCVCNQRETTVVVQSPVKNQEKQFKS